MWKLLGWPLALSAAVGAYWLHAEGQKRERVLVDQLQVQQQLVAQVSNRLTVVEAQFALYRAKQEKETKERELRERELREPERVGLRPAPTVDRPAPVTRNHPEEPEESPEELQDDTRTRHGNSPGRSIGNGINTIIDRLREGLNN